MAYSQPRFANGESQAPRFSSSDNQNQYYSQYSAGITPVAQPTANSTQSSLGNNAGQQQNSLPLSAYLSNFDNGTPGGAQKPLEMLLVSLPITEINKIKSQNLTKYQMKPDSLLYYFHVRQLETIMATYPFDFPTDLRDQMRKQLKSIRSRASFFVNLMFGSVGYSLLCRNRVWFKLTGNLSNRLLFMFFSLNCFWDTINIDNDYSLKQVFANNRVFEQAVTKHNLVPSTNFKMKLITES